MKLSLLKVVVFISLSQYIMVWKCSFPHWKGIHNSIIYEDLEKNRYNKSYRKENYYINNSINRNKILGSNHQSKELAYRIVIIFVSYTWVRWFIFKIHKEIMLGVERLNQGWEYRENWGLGEAKPKDRCMESNMEIF